MTECLIGSGASNGKGHLQRTGAGRKRHYRHRDAWEIRNGPIPEGLVIHHLCGHPSCLNPDHMELVTRTEHGRLHREEKHRIERPDHEPEWFTRVHSVSGNKWLACKVCRKQGLA